VAIVVTELLAAGSTLDQQVYTTGSMTIGQDELILVGVFNGLDEGDGTAGAVTLTGLSQTWVLVHSAVRTAGDSSVRLSVLRCMKATAGTTSGALTITIAGTNNLGAGWVALKVAGLATGSNGSTAVVQSATQTTGNATSVTVSLATFGDSGNGVVAFYGHMGTATITPEGGYASSTQVATNFFLAPNTTFEAARLRAASLAGVDVTPSATCLSADDWWAVALELKNATASTPTAVGRSQGFIN
jgi:hypothetical protein